MHPPLPFNARAARTLREKLGMAHGHVAYGMRASYGMTHITPDHVAAWERGTALPTADELTALAGALWCAPGELMGHARTLREHRLARGLPVEDVARATGLTLDAYHHMEETGLWTGDKRQSAALGSVLGLPPRDFIAITGLENELARLLTEAVSTRWQAHIRAIAKLVAIERRDLQDPLRTMQQDYQILLAATLSRAGGSTASGEDGRRYLDEIVDHFWALLPDH
ncbi:MULTISPECIES: helix-turn-helix transcriptional regulator [unclassified Streptomyces]|uniref:helix-turn-helix transcriptional regulator n=1 Tax=unclassified Streptomyces TaxID=2593676 RepID=UPI002786D6EF|nr:helix-turn-helix transcriptional regulator [Streptomyces sp. V1I6]MDQ0845197.1 transcriptional regulator with XRE-family HTH domain [Streptomyces sp. V1I6]